MRKFILLVVLLVSVFALAVNHPVVLSWNGPSTTGTSALTGYNVYRGTAHGGPYVKIGSTDVLTLTYTDNATVAGTTYYYVVTATNATDESSYSNEASGTIPVPPGPPTNVQTQVTTVVLTVTPQ
jgi:fibronectin type 3 domain-containing protein